LSGKGAELEYYSTPGGELRAIQLEEGRLGATIHKTRTILIDDSDSESELRATFLHEMIHYADFRIMPRSVPTSHSSRVMAARDVGIIWEAFGGRVHDLFAAHPTVPRLIDCSQLS